MDKTTIILNLLIFFLSAGFGIFVFSKNPRSKINLYFSLFIFSVAGWILTLVLFYTADQANILFYGRLNFAFAELPAFFSLYFGYYFPKRTFRFNRSVFYVFNLATAALLYATLFTGLIDKNELITPNGVRTVFGPLYPLFVLYTPTFLLAMIVLPFLKYKKLAEKEIMQVKYLAIAMILLISITCTTNIFVPYLYKNFNAQNIGPIGFLLFIAITSYAVIKHQLLNINVIIQKSLLYSFLLSLVTGFYLLAVFSISFIFGHPSKTINYLAAVITTVVGIFGAPQIKRYFIKKTDKFFYKDTYDYSQAVESLSRILNKNIVSEKLIKNTAEKLKDYLKPSFIKIYLIDDKKSFSNGRPGLNDKTFNPEIIKKLKESQKTIIDKNEINKIIANNKKKKSAAARFFQDNGIYLMSVLKNDKNFVGFLFLGEKMSKDPYSRDDISLLKTFSYQAAVALEKAKYYEKIKNYSNDLERQVKKRTEKITRLQEEQKQMLIDVSHNLQTPLTIMKTELDVLSKKNNNKNLRNFEKTIDKLSVFIYGLLKLSRLETGKILLEKTNFNLSELLEELCDSYEIITQDKDISITRSINDKIFIKADRQKMEEAINNLVSNSIKYIGNGDKIKISLKKEMPNIIISVWDNGQGIPRESLKNIFNRFYRVRDKNEDRIAGTGLGLSFCKKIIEMHGGKMEAKSQVNTYTEFKIILSQK